MTHELVTTPTGVDWKGELNGASMLLKSGLAPVSLKTPEAALFVILAGRDLGLSPTQSLRSINVIQGKVEVGADMQLALFKRAGGRAEWTTLTEAAATLVLTHPNGDKHTESFTMADAKRAGLSGNNWQKFPKAMLRSRCITAAMKSVGFDVLAGVYAPGEVGGPETLSEEPEAAGEAPKQITAPSSPPAQEAEVVEERQDENAPDDMLDAATAFCLPFGKSKGLALGAMETDNLESALAWAESAKANGRYPDFVAAAKVVLDARTMETVKPQRVQASESGGIGIPEEQEAEPALPF